MQREDYRQRLKVGLSRGSWQLFHRNVSNQTTQKMTISRAELEAKIKELEEKIVETKRRLPAHSIKPPVMMDLLALEDERDEVLRQLEKLSGS